MAFLVSCQTVEAGVADAHSIILNFSYNCWDGMGILKFFWYSSSCGLIPHWSLCVDRHSAFYFDPMITYDNIFSWGQGLGVQTLAILPNTGSCKFLCQFRDPVILFALCPVSLTQKYLQRCKMINGMRPVGHKDQFEGPCQYLQSFRYGC